MGVFKAIPERFSRVHAVNLTPTWATIGMGVVSAAFYVPLHPDQPEPLFALIGSVGLMIAFYYGLTGFVCVWFYRKTLTRTRRDLVMRGIVPLLGGLIMLATFVYGLLQFLAPDWLLDDQGEPVTILGRGARRCRRPCRPGPRPRSHAGLVGHAPGVLPRRDPPETVRPRAGPRRRPPHPRASPRAAGLRPAGDRHRARPVQPARGGVALDLTTGEIVAGPLAEEE